jgi:multidrug efflux system membrane fusion protein
MHSSVRQIAMLFLLASSSMPAWFVSALAADAGPKVVVQTPSRQAVTRYFYATGTVSAVASVDLVGRVSGTLAKVARKDGAVVRKGDVLFVIEQAPYEIAVQGAQATLDQQNANLTQANENLARQQDLFSKKATSASTVENAVAQAATSKALVAAAEASLKTAKLNLGYTEIKSPLDGILSARLYEEGAYINAAQTPKLASVIQPDPFRVNFTASEADIIRLRKAIAARKISIDDLGAIAVDIGLPSETDYPYPGKLDYISPDLDATTGTIALRAIAENRQKLFSPGMFVRLRIPLGKAVDALAVPDRAIGTGQEGTTVLVIGKSGQVETRLVTLGQPLGNGLTEVANGLAAADRVVVEGLDNVQPGDTPTIVDKLQ